MAVVFANNAKTTLASSVSTTATSITVADGSVFPAISGSDYTYVTFEDTSSNIEVVKVTARSGNTLTVVRGQDGTTATAYSAGDKCELRITAALLNDLNTEADTESVSRDGDSMSGNLSLGDGNKVIFGAGSDLEIYHTGAASYIEEKGTGSLYIKGTQLRMQATDGTTYIEADDGGAVTLKYSGSNKIATTSTGVDVTGTVTADGLTVDGNATITTADNSDTLVLVSTDADANVGPVLSLYRNSASPADNDVLGRIIFKGEDDAGNQNTFALIDAIATDITNGSEDGRLDFKVANNDTFNAALSLSSGAVTAYHGGTARLATTSTGISVTGDISNTSGDLTLDVAGDIILDADGADFKFRDGGAGFLTISNSSLDVVFKSEQSNEDILFKGNDGGSEITALTLDMSEAGEATFNADVLLLGDNQNLRIGADQDLMLFFDGTDAVMRNVTSNSDILFKGNDGGSTITALTLNMSEAGEATFNSDILLGDSKVARFGADQDFRISFDGSSGIIQNVTSDSDIIFKGNDGGSTITALSLDMSDAGTAIFRSGAVFNEDSLDQDFRVESNSNTHALFVDAGNDRVGVGGIPNSRMEIISDGSDAAGSELRLTHANNNTNDVIATLNFANNVGSAARIRASTTGANNTGLIQFFTDSAGTDSQVASFQAEKIVFNETGNNQDFRIESDNKSHLFYVDASNDGVGIGDGYTLANGLKIASTTSTTNAIDTKLYLQGLSSGTTTTGFGTGITFAGARNGDGGNQQMAQINAIAEVNSGTTLSSGLSFQTATAGVNSEKMRIHNDGAVKILGTTSPNLNLLPNGVLGNADISYDGTDFTLVANSSSATMKLSTYSTERFRLNAGSAGAVFNALSNDYDFRVESNNNAHMLFVDAGNDRIGINDSSPSHLLTVKSDHATNPAIKIEQTGNTDGWGFIANNNEGRLEFSRIGGGTEGTHLAVTNQGLVGIGTVDIDERLHVQRSSGTTLVKTEVSANSVVGFEIHKSTGSPSRWRIADGQVANGSLDIYDITNSRSILHADSQEAVINDSSAELDFRVESNNNANMLFVDAEYDAIIIGDSASHTSDQLQIETPASGGGHGIQIRRNDSNNDQQVGRVLFGNNTDTELAQVAAKTDGATDSGALLFSTSATGASLVERMRIASDYTVQFKMNTGSLSHLFQYNENGGEIFLYDGGGAQATLIDQSNNSSRFLELIDGSNLAIGLGSANTTGDVLFYRAGFAEAMRIKSSEVIVNEGSADLDFRVESDSNSNGIFLDASANSLAFGNTVKNLVSNYADQHGVGIDILTGEVEISGDATPLELGRTTTAGAAGDFLIFRTESTIRGGISNTSANDLRIRSSSGKLKLGETTDYVMVDTTASNAAIYLVDNSQSNPPTIRGNGPNFTLENQGYNRIAMYNGSTVVNDDSRDQDFRVESNGNSHAFFVDAGADEVNVGTPTGPNAFNVLGKFDNTGFYRNYSGAGTAATYVKIGRQDTNGNLVDGVRIVGGGDDNVEASHNGYFNLEIRNSGTHRSLISALNSGNEFVVNNDSHDMDFRVESNNYSHMLFMDASADSMGIKQTSPSSYYATDLVVGAGSSEQGITIRGSSSGRSYLMFADGTSGNERYRGYVSYNHNTDELEFAAGAATHLTLSSGGHLLTQGTQTITSSTNQLSITSNGGTGYTQGSIIISSSNTANSPGSRGQGIYYFNGGNDVTWYGGTLYGSGSTWSLNYQNSTQSSSNSTASLSNGTPAFTAYNSASGIVFNENGIDRDFRIESDNKSYAFHVDASADQVCIGRSANNSASADLVTPFGTYGLLLESTGSTVSQNSYIDMTVNSGGGGFQGMLTVSNTFKANAGARTHTMFFIAGRGTDAVATSIASDNGSSGAISFTVTFPSNGVIRITNTYAGDTSISAVFIGSQGF